MCFNITILMPAQKSAGQWPTQSHTKNVLFFKKNAVGHATFVGQPTRLAGLITHV